MDRHHFRKPDPDQSEKPGLDTRHSENTGSDSDQHQSSNSGDTKAQHGSTEARGRSQWRRED
jgi:hypothetical protein